MLYLALFELNPLLSQVSYNHQMLVQKIDKIVSTWNLVQYYLSFMFR